MKSLLNIQRSLKGSFKSMKAMMDSAFKTFPSVFPKWDDDVIWRELRRSSFTIAILAPPSWISRFLQQLRKPFTQKYQKQ